MIHLFGVLTVAAYVGAALLQLHLLLRTPDLRRHSTALRCLQFGLACHTALLACWLFPGAALPLDRALYLLWFSWLPVCAYLFAPPRLRNPLIGAFVSAAAALTFIASSVVAHAAQARQLAGAESAFVFAVHVLRVLVEEASLVFAGAASGAWLLQDHWLRRKSGRTLRVRGPSLESLSRVSRRSTLIGFFMMTLGMLSGAVWAVSRGWPLLGYDPAQWGALLTWLTLAGVLHARLYLFWPERRLARLTVALTVLLFGAILVSLLFFERGTHAAL